VGIVHEGDSVPTVFQASCSIPIPEQRITSFATDNPMPAIKGLVESLPLAQRNIWTTENARIKLTVDLS
jgi:hypothetical protein